MESMPTAEHPALATAAGDLCSSCGAPLAPDQRYCVQCGQRRGQSSLPVMQPAGLHEREVVHTRGARLAVGGNTALIAGVGTLLLAMGVGVLIGHSSRQAEPTRAASPVQVVTVAGGGGTGTTAATATTAKGPKGAKASKTTGKSATSADAAKAAAKIKGTNIKLPKKAVVKVGSPGSGPGYQNGKFTGNFFGG
jgi:hypothetical protein